jgi:putative membrane protein
MRFVWWKCVTPARHTIRRSGEIAPVAAFRWHVWQAEHISVSLWRRGVRLGPREIAGLLPICRRLDFPCKQEPRAMSTLFAFLHHLCAFTLVSAVAIEFTLIRQELTLSSARRLQVTDMVLGIAAGALFIVGLLRVFYFEKGADYYFHSHAFMAKFSIFIAIGLLSIVPTVEFLSWRSAVSAGQVPAVSAKKLRLITAVIHGELLSIVIILLCAAIMARGGWV